MVKLLAHKKELRETEINSNPYFTPETEEELIKLENIYRKQLRPWKFLRNVGARCLAILCVNWLNGQNDGTWINMK